MPNIFYPDIVVTCDPRQFDRELVEVPHLVVEVLSPTQRIIEHKIDWPRRC